jgi:hypothetical protein
MTDITSESKLTKSQYKSFGPRAVEGYGKGAALWVSVCFDDECSNGHNSFAITAHVTVPKRRDWEACGCLHEDIAAVYPELAPLIKWHLCSTDGPMHYVANTVYLASERDCWHKLKGEPYSFEAMIHFGKNPIKHKFGKRFTKFLQDAKPHPGATAYDFEVIAVAHEDRSGETYKFRPKYTFGGFDAKWHECPFDTEEEALDFLAALQTCDPQFVSMPTAWGEGKERELDKARAAAIWPEATDEELTAPGLEERLAARLPGLLAEFRSAVEGLGFTW